MEHDRETQGSITVQRLLEGNMWGQQAGFHHFLKTVFEGKRLGKIGIHHFVNCFPREVTG